MIAEGMKKYVEGASAIRAMFEKGELLSKEYGKDNVFDFSIGNPSLPPPEELEKAIEEIITTENPTMVHGYNRSNAGYEDVRSTVANHLNRLHQTDFTFENVIMTAGAAAGLNISFKTLLDQGDEVIVFAPFFLEYRNYVANYGGKLTVIPANTKDFQPNLEEFEKAINEKTKAVIVNSPNNPTGVVYSEETIIKLAEILKKKEKEYNKDIYIIADEPYRELVYDGVKVPFITKYYDNTIVAYSWSKSLSLPGERIGYLLFPSNMNGFKEVVTAASIASRILGYVNAPTLIQRAVAKAIDCQVNIEIYDENRKTLCDGLSEAGYEYAKPEGTFYIFLKSVLDDDVAFCKEAEKYNILMVPGSSFGCPGYARIAYCVDLETIKRALPKFKELKNKLTD